MSYTGCSHPLTLADIICRLLHGCGVTVGTPLLAAIQCRSLPRLVFPTEMPIKFRVFPNITSQATDKHTIAWMQAKQ